MLFLFLFAVLAATAAGVWFQGLWSAAITLVNMLLAMIVATSFFEPVCTAIEGISAARTYTYLLDFIVLWVLFAITFGILRTFTDDRGNRRRHQEMRLAKLGPPRDLILRWTGSKRLGAGVAVFCGTASVPESPPAGPKVEIELEDPVLGRTLLHSYRLQSPPLVS